jgi:hypothetical protein
MEAPTWLTSLWQVVESKYFLLAKNAREFSVHGVFAESSKTILPTLVVTVAVFTAGVAVELGSPTNLLWAPASLVYAHWTVGRAVEETEDLGVLDALGVVLGVGEAVGVLAVAVGDGMTGGMALGVEEKPPSPMLTERAAMATSAIKTPIVPRLNVGFWTTCCSTLGPFGRLVLPPLRCTGGCDDTLLAPLPLVDRGTVTHEYPFVAEV